MRNKFGMISDQDKAKLQKLVELVFPQLPLKPTGMIIVTVDGFHLCDVGMFREHVDKTKYDGEEPFIVPAMASAMMSLGERISSEIQGAPLKFACLESSHGVSLLYAASDNELCLIDWTHNVSATHIYAQWQDIMKIIRRISKFLNWLDL